MATRLVTSDYGVDASVENRFSAGQAPKGVSRGDKEEPHGENREDHRHGEAEYERRERKKAVRGINLWNPGIPDSLTWGSLYYSQIMKGTFHIPAIRDSCQFQITRSKDTSLVHLTTICAFSSGRQSVRKRVDSLSE
jgi:hypothetical protein